MTQLLQNAIHVVQQLSPEQQDRIANLMLNIAHGKRSLGLAKGLLCVPENFNDELPPDELDNWYNSRPSDPLT